MIPSCPTPQDSHEGFNAFATPWVLTLDCFQTLNCEYLLKLLAHNMTRTFLNHPEQTPTHAMDQFLLWTPEKETITHCHKKTPPD